ncbi:MAG: hypothetical protein WKF91_08250 [Segetibacter sp.]
MEEQEDLKTKITDWQKNAVTINEREPQWYLVSELVNFANGDMEHLKLEIEAIRENRLLLQEPNPVEPKLVELTDKLKEALNQLKSSYIRLYDVKMNDLQHTEYFDKLSPEQKHSILAKHQLLAKPEIKSLDAHGLLLQLQKASLYTWDTKIAALPGQFQSALEEAIQLAAPKAKTYSLPRTTIKTNDDIDTYLKELKIELEALLKESNSIILK